MILTNKERELLSSLQNKYNKKFCSSLGFVDRVILAIEIIEKEHRNIVWRFFEYIYLGYSFIFCCVNNNQIKNISIGKYQIKINIILDYLNIEYTLDGKNIKMLEHRLPVQALIFKNRNNKMVLYRLIERKGFNFFHEKIIYLEKLKYFIQEYSGNLSFNEDFNYFFVLKELIKLDKYFDNN
ncbi:MAG: hypothetical protein LBC76_03995 [Treponema sp.]|jgi:hypothetical protein|nr:hypothetical protein [Treponema sp.]